MAVVIIAPLVAQIAEGIVADIIALFPDEDDQVSKSTPSHFQGSNTPLRKRRTKFTMDIIHYLSNQHPEFNWVVCHPSHETRFDGVEGTDWGHFHHELPLSLDRTIG